MMAEKTNKNGKNLRLETYLFLEKIAYDARHNGDKEFAELISENIKPFWSALSEEDIDSLLMPKIKNE